MKRLFSFLFVLIFLFGTFSIPVSAEKDPIYDIALDSQGVYVYNPETDTAIYEKAAESRMFPASTTKIMTCLVVLEACADPHTEIVTVPSTSMFDYIIEDGGVHTALAKGEKFTVYDLLLGMMMNSFCDVSDLLAYHFGNGDISAFVDQMNQKAAELDLKNTNFENAHGLHSKNHYSSPKDMAKILCTAMENPLFREIVSTRSYTIPATNRHAERPLRYTVDVYYPTSDFYLECFVGGKSGYTDQAGRCLATSSEQDGITFVSVLFGANMDRTRYYPGNMAHIETHTLLSYAYDNFEIRTLVEKGTKMAEIAVTDSETNLPLLTGEDIRVLIRKGSTPEYTLDFPQEIPVSQVQNGATIGSVQLAFNDSVEAAGTYPLLLSWDGVPIPIKSKIEKDAENAIGAVSGIFETDKIFLTLLILLFCVIAVCVPALKITKAIHKKKSHRPKH